ncbi:hypothetical protein E1211_27815 [Micromonospora sp. 15K316]|uniref:hypothetical protein n=1 Tax=Micromonospora sp. 15K316 TaxID=2530376 RepID=UPI001048B663|nr:hypothetical protein [Micromonospora sp. 15K316]TDC28494.1 hypothetical protein E1211_27815 [Micromonospora sp. 15K316]
MGVSKAKQAEVSERRRKAISLKLAGLSWQAVADQLGYRSRGAACQDVSRALEQYRRDEAQQVEMLRHVEGERYDRLQAAFWPKALQGDPKSADVILKVMAGRSKLFGLDAPAKVQHSGQVATYQIVGVDPDALV